MNDNLRNQIYNNLNLKDTDELVEIWQTKDQNEWSDLSFDVIREILIKRLGELPPQFDQEDYNNGEEDEPVFYDTEQVYWMGTWLDIIAKISIVAVVVVGLLNLPDSQIRYRDFLIYFIGGYDWNSVALFLAFTVFMVSAMIKSALLYFFFKTLALILMILMEMEFNSRELAFE